MTTDHLTPAQRRAGRLFLGEHCGWGYSVSVPAGPSASIADGVGWNGGAGTTWRSDLRQGTTAILFTQRMMTSPEPPAAFADLFTVVDEM
jgi:CubicO group peptidase (beta-lactamase class C family)